MARSAIQSLRSLMAKALEQGGYFTAKQAKDAGYGYSHIEYHESTGQFEKIGHGLYRLSSLPPGEHDEYIRLSLWSRNRADVPQAVVSHESALILHDLSELLPNRIDLTVPRSFRKAVPRGVMLHKASIQAEETEERIGFRVTTPLRTILDVSVSGVSQEQLLKAIREAIQRGQVRKSKLIEAIKLNPRLTRLTDALATLRIKQQRDSST